ncbi:BSD domain-containing protein [Artemisia annua]|uniref:BSD domain-containing protein n=1 Tax=Artemisia annua TaxID=35608 RepID=A0A2U1LI52_ARTAN|nr:BSD domain-containing protein [Artemisia annua]
MDFWQKARTFAETTAKKSQDFTIEAAKRSQDLTIGSSKLSDLISEASSRSKQIALEASKRSKEIALEAVNKADSFKTEAIKRADQIKSQIPVTTITSLVGGGGGGGGDEAVVEKAVHSTEELERFGVTEELREFVQEITANTFCDFPLEDDSQVSDIPTISNVRQDLTKWQETHAKLIISTVKEISKLRYELCPRFMRERKFWRIYFILVNSHVTPYERRFMEEEENKKAAENVKEDAAVGSPAPAPAAETISKSEASGEKSENQKTKTASTKTSEQDLDVFLLGDLGDSDEGPDDGDDGLDDDDFDKL